MNEVKPNGMSDYTEFESSLLCDQRIGNSTFRTALIYKLWQLQRGCDPAMEDLAAARGLSVDVVTRDVDALVELGILKAMKD